MIAFLLFSQLTVVAPKASFAATCPSPGDGRWGKVTLTAARQRVADCLARGLSYADTAKELGICRTTVKAHVFAIAQRIPNPDGLPQKEAILRWLGAPRSMADTAPAVHA